MTTATKRMTKTYKSAKVDMKSLEASRTKITDEMTVGEAKEVLSSENKFNNSLFKVATRWLLEYHGLDVEKEAPNWQSFTMTLSGKLDKGTVIVVRFHDDDRTSTETGHWTVTKNKLMKLYGK